MTKKIVITLDHTSTINNKRSKTRRRKTRDKTKILKTEKTYRNVKHEAKFAEHTPKGRTGALWGDKQMRDGKKWNVYPNIQRSP